ncbi:MAG: SDR family oxidoreductase [Acidobacteriota bacterium]|nr:SDR family oxidoreductase [Acidobacteriota bacterium]
MSQGLVILGATSKIAQEVGRLAARENRELLLVARNEDRLEAVAGDLLARGAARVVAIAADLGDTSRHAELWAQVEAAMPELESVLLAYGSLGDQAAAEQSVDVALSELNTNFTSAASLLSYAAASLERQRRGVLAVITSVAGDRARRSNYVYGTAKGALSLYAQGLRARLFAAGVRVLTIKPGPVDTPMIAHMKKGALTASPQNVAGAIYREMESGKAEVMYVPFFWRYIMALIRAIPESVGKKLKF